MVVLVKPHCELILYLKVYNVKETYCNYPFTQGGHHACQAVLVSIGLGIKQLRSSSLRGSFTKMDYDAC